VENQIKAETSQQELFARLVAELPDLEKQQAEALLKSLEEWIQNCSDYC
jgi:hypothetical protein